ncbi:MAG: hypothetical protein ACR2OG_13480 [Gemmatimonadaceae bacterium]
MSRWLVPVAIVVGSLTAGWLVFTYLLSPGGPFAWDEAAHAMRGVVIARDIHAGEGLAFLYDSYRQVYWPPVHAWLTAAAFLVMGPSTMAARCVSLVAFVLLAPTLYVAGRMMAGRRGELAGAAAAALALTSPPLAAYAALAMLELPALLALALTVLVFIWLGRPGTPPPPRRHALLGLGIMLTYFTRSSYAIILLLAIATTLLIKADFRPARLITRENGYAALPIILLSIIWFAYPPKVASTWRALVGVPWGGPKAQGVNGLLFYPRALFHLSGSVWIFLLLLASVAAGWRARRDRNVILLLVLIAIQFVIGTLHHTKLERYLFPVLPALYLLAGLAAAEWWGRLPNRGVPRVVAGAVLASALALQLRSLVGSTREAPPTRPTEAILGYVAGLVRLTEPTLVLGTMDMHPGPPATDWHLVTHGQLLAPTRAGSVFDVEFERAATDRLRSVRAPNPLRDEILHVLTRYDAGTATRSFYLGLPGAIDRSRFDAMLRRTLAGATFGGVVVMTALADTARYPLAFVAPSLQRCGLRHVSERSFADASLRVDLYQTLARPPGSR